MKRDYECIYEETETLYKIGLFSQMNRVTIKTLRHYDEVGLLSPAHVDNENGYRYYSSHQLPDLNQIICLRQIGMTLDEIARIQKGQSIEDILKCKRVELMEVIAKETMKLSQVEHYLSNGSFEKDYHVVLKELPEVIAASVRTKIPNYEALFSIVPSMGMEMERLGCICAVPEYCFNIYHDGGYKAEDIDVEICEAVTKMKQDTDNIAFKQIPRVETAACVIHKGPYEQFPKAYEAVVGWIEDNHFEMTDMPRESYIDGAWNRESEEEWLTEIQFPVRKKS